MHKLIFVHKKYIIIIINSSTSICTYFIIKIIPKIVLVLSIIILEILKGKIIDKYGIKKEIYSL